MLAARAVAGPLQRGATRFAQRQARSIHIPPPLRQPSATANFSNRFQHLLRWAVSQFSATAASLRSSGPQTARTFSKQAPRMSIQSSLSMPARFALSRPLGAPTLPRPAVVPRSMTQVGLGTARTFATTRPIFQNIVDNVPVAGRALWEAGWDIDTQQGQKAKLSKPPKKSKGKKSSSMMMPMPVPKPQWESGTESALSQYFALPEEPAVVTYLDIPLAPTPTGRMPLAEFPLARAPLIPRRAVADAHATHDKHAIRVASLFRKLDAARVWEKGAAMEAFGDRTGLCTVLRVAFSGWTKADVQQVIDEGGKGWCTLIEVPIEQSRSPSIDSCAPSPLASTPASPRMSIGNIDTAAFIMPTLDFSSSFLENAWASTPGSELPSGTPSDWSDVASLSDESAWAEVAPSVNTATVGLSAGVSFSSEHWRRVSAFVSDF